MIKSLVNVDWPVAEGIHAISTVRWGGVSLGAYDSLNLAMHVGDSVQSVSQNRKILRQQCSLPSEPVWLNQTHSSKVICADTAMVMPVADASFTGQSGIVCAVLTADCLPVLLADKQGQWVGAVHCGWRGLLSGVLENTLIAMPGVDFIAWFGPAIGNTVFEVGDEVRDAFMKKSPKMEDAFKSFGKGYFLADIYKLARLILKDAGIDDIYGGTYCTFTDASQFFSYRREKVTGRMVSLIWREF
ncbi:MAG: peptidoglycan editing factor PgeF [Methylococcales bacterium]|nr:peptidoglycan editing factor PgeF [Methylococcaceae bacterium]HIL39528.1 peptidoglycan editing factor PgeF [Methylococcales bacterium]